MKTQKCLCDSKKKYSNCCGRFLDKDECPNSPVELMRSRYTAFAKQGYGQYLYHTWHHSKRTQTADELNTIQVKWVKLKVLEASKNGNKGTVNFKATYKSTGQYFIHHEISSFIKIDNKWYYVDGQVIC